MPETQDIPLMPKTPVLVIGGPTASGKSGLALLFGERYQGTIINADSIQLYDALPVLTAQPDATEQARLPHRLYGGLSPNSRADAQIWRAQAIDEMDKATAGGRLPLIVGGTGFYIKALLEGLSPIPEISEEQRAAVISEYQQLGFETFYAESCKRDPKIKNLIDPQNPQRVMRAREVFEATGKSLLDWQELPKSGPPKGYRFFMITVLPDRAALYQRCDSRFEDMFQSGALEQTADLKARIDRGEVSETAPVTKAIGFAELSAYLDGDLTKEEAIASAAKATRNYAKRQSTWFRNQIKADYIFDPAAETAPLFRHFEQWRG